MAALIPTGNLPHPWPQSLFVAHKFAQLHPDDDSAHSSQMRYSDCYGSS
jgi:hypothetical protein